MNFRNTRLLVPLVALCALLVVGASLAMATTPANTGPPTTAEQMNNLQTGLAITGLTRNGTFPANALITTNRNDGAGNNSRVAPINTANGCGAPMTVYNANSITPVESGRGNGPLTTTGVDQS